MVGSPPYGVVLDRKAKVVHRGTIEIFSLGKLPRSDHLTGHIGSQLAPAIGGPTQ